MSQENVEIVRRYIGEYGDAPPDMQRLDMQRLAADFYDPDADYYPVRKFPEARPCHGVEEISAFWPSTGTRGTATSSRSRS